MAKIYQFPGKDDTIGGVDKFCWVLVELVDKVFITTTKDDMICVFETKPAADRYLERLKMDPRNESIVHTIAVQKILIQNA